MRFSCLLSYVLLPLICSCQQGSRNSEAHSDKIKKDSTRHIGNEGLIAEISQNEIFLFFTESERHKIKHAAVLFDTLTHEETLASLYLQIMPDLREIIQNGIQQSLDKEVTDDPEKFWADIHEVLPFIVSVKLCEHCDVEVFADLNVLSSKASQTIGQEDDAYFSMARMYYSFGEHENRVYDGNFSSWYRSEGCEGCGADILGGGKHVKVLKEIDKISSEHEPYFFKQTVADMRKKILPALNNHYLYSREKAVDEIDQILANVQLSERETDNLNALRNKLLKTKYIQFNCATGKCRAE